MVLAPKSSRSMRTPSLYSLNRLINACLAIKLLTTGGTPKKGSSKFPFSACTPVTLKVLEKLIPPHLVFSKHFWPPSIGIPNPQVQTWHPSHPEIPHFLELNDRTKAVRIGYLDYNDFICVAMIKLSSSFPIQVEKLPLVLPWVIIFAADNNSPVTIGPLALCSP